MTSSRTNVPSPAERPALTTARLAELAGGRLVGRGDVVIRGVAEIGSASADDVTYAVNRTYLKRLATTKAGAVIIPQGSATDLDLHVPLIEARNPYWSFAQLLRAFAPVVPPHNEGIHPTAVVADDVELGDGVVVGPLAVIDRNVRIGPGSTIGAGCFIGYGTRVGSHVLLHPGVIVREFTVMGDRTIVHGGSVIGSDGYGFVEEGGRYEKIPQIGHVEIGDDVEIGSLVTIDRATIGTTIIGSGSKLDNLIQIGHNVEIGEHCALVAQVGISGSTIIGDHCRFAGQSATSGHLTIGPRSSVAARGVITHDLPPGSFVSGFPAKPHAEARRISAAQTKLPELLRRVAELERRLGLRGGPDASEVETE